jgi:hypothetical protein
VKNNRAWPVGEGALVEITLSRRNLEELIAMLDQRREGKFDVTPQLSKTSYDTGFHMLIVHAEENDVHYERVQKKVEV